MISNQTAMDEDLALTRLAVSVLEFIERKRGPVSCYLVLSSVAACHGVPECQVATAISRVAGQLNWDYSAGEVHFSIKESGEVQIMRYTRDDLPTDGWAEYRKVATTRMTPITGPCTVVTMEGPYDLPEGWTGYLALDTKGWPYPVDAAVHAESYERAE